MDQCPAQVFQNLLQDAFPFPCMELQYLMDFDRSAPVWGLFDSKLALTVVDRINASIASSLDEVGFPGTRIPDIHSKHPRHC